MKRVSQVGGMLLAAGAALAGALWLLRDRIFGPPPAPAMPAEPPAFREPPAAPDGTPDDLSEVKGIGPVYSERLTEAGITTFSALAATPLPKLAEIAGVAESRAADWLRQAADLAG